MERRANPKTFILLQEAVVTLIPKVLALKRCWPENLYENCYFPAGNWGFCLLYSDKCSRGERRGSPKTLLQETVVFLHPKVLIPKRSRPENRHFPAGNGRVCGGNVQKTKEIAYFYTKTGPARSRPPAADPRQDKEA